MTNDNTLIFDIYSNVLIQNTTCPLRGQTWGHASAYPFKISGVPVPQTRPRTGSQCDVSVCYQNPVFSYVAFVICRFFPSTQRPRACRRQFRNPLNHRRVQRGVWSYRAEGHRVWSRSYLPSLVDEVDKMNPNWREESGVITVTYISFLFGTVSLVLSTRALTQDIKGRNPGPDINRFALWRGWKGAGVWWIWLSTTMSPPTAIHTSPISHHVRATKRILQDVNLFTKYVWNG